MSQESNKNITTIKLTESTIAQMLGMPNFINFLVGLSSSTAIITATIKGSNNPEPIVISAKIPQDINSVLMITVADISILEFVIVCIRKIKITEFVTNYLSFSFKKERIKVGKFLRPFCLITFVYLILISLKQACRVILVTLKSRVFVNISVVEDFVEVWKMIILSSQNLLCFVV